MYLLMFFCNGPKPSELVGLHQTHFEDSQRILEVCQFEFWTTYLSKLASRSA